MIYFPILNKFPCKNGQSPEVASTTLLKLLDCDVRLHYCTSGAKCISKATITEASANVLYRSFDLVILTRCYEIELIPHTRSGQRRTNDSIDSCWDMATEHSTQHTREQYSSSTARSSDSTQQSTAHSTQESTAQHLCTVCTTADNLLGLANYWRISKPTWGSRRTVTATA